MDCGKQVLEAAQILNLTIVQVEQDIADRIRTQLSKYLRGEMDKTLCFVEAQHAWMWMKDYVQDKEVILFFARGDTPKMFRVSGGQQLQAILEEIGCEPLYITSESADFLIEWTDVDYLIAYLGAMDWLRTYAHERNLPVKCHVEEETFPLNGRGDPGQ